MRRQPLRWKPVSAALALLFVSAAAPLRAIDLLTVDLKTNYVPYEEFFGVHITVVGTTSGTTLRADHVPTLVEDYLEGTRVSDFPELPADAEFLITVELVGGEGTVIASPRVLLTGGPGTYSTTLLAARPEGEAAKVGSLQVDADGDGAISAGDTVRYQVSLSGIGGATFTDEPRAGAHLVNGSVTTTHGSVAEGNGAGDARVVVSGLALDHLAVATVIYDVVVDPVLENQGSFDLDHGGHRRIPTDDPLTAEPGDPTLLPVACGFSECSGDLETCETELEDAEEELETLLADGDADAVPAVLDLCPGTPAGAAVDERGCSQAQFCARIDVSAPQGNGICRRADWGGDEPTGNPLDCRPRTGVCEADV